MKLNEATCMYIAGLIGRAAPSIGDEHRKSVAELFATDLGAENPLFEREKFLLACGLTADQITPQDTPLF